MSELAAIEGCRRSAATSPFARFHAGDKKVFGHSYISPSRPSSVVRIRQELWESSYVDERDERKMNTGEPANPPHLRFVTRVRVKRADWCEAQVLFPRDTQGC